MDFIADIFLGAGALAAALYCMVLSRKLSKLSGLDQDLGSAIAVMSQQVDEMSKALNSAQETAAGSSASLEGMTQRAEDVAGRLELMMAALHDLPVEEEQAPEVGPAPPVDTAPEITGENVSVFLRNPNRAAGNP